VARVRDLPGCTARAATPEELWDAVERAKREWIEDALRRGERVPEPGGGGGRRSGGESRGEYSGRILVRVPKSMHAELVVRAAQEGVSLNQFILAALARSLGPAAVQGEYMPPGAPGGRRRGGRGAPGPGQGPLAERD
jgi:antitoxin HicB